MEKKKPYMKPELKKVELVPEEAVLTMCKTASGGTAKSNKCATPSCKNINGS